MAVSRRSVLLQGSAAGAGLIASGVPGFDALAQQNQPVVRRRSVTDLQPNDPIIEAYRTAVVRLRERRGNERVSWASLAAIHGTEAGFNRCPHGNWYFLPWHRAYILSYERIIREVSGMRDFALPYWDWTQQRRMPRVFADRTLRNGQPNPLHDPARTMTPTTSLADENVGDRVIQGLLSAVNFEVFGSSRPRGQNNTNNSWIARRTGNQGPLEANPHNNVHATLGGMMATSRSPLDPIFLMHHCNVDRIWSLWNERGNQNVNDRLWSDMQFRDHFLDPQGRPYSPFVRDLFRTEDLGYTYTTRTTGTGTNRPQPPVREQGPQVSGLRERLGQFFRGLGDDNADADAPSSSGRRSAEPQRAGARGVFDAANSETGVADRPLEIPVTINTDLVTSAAKKLGDQSGGRQYLPDIDVEEEEKAAGPEKSRAYAFIRNCALTRIDTTQVRVFLDCDYLSQGTPIDDDHYVGTFSFFGEHSSDQSGGHDGHSRGEDRPSIVVDLTPALEKLYNQESPQGQVRVQLLPVPNVRSKVADVGQVTPASVEVVFI